jgi:hypothetical protein
MGGSWTSDCSSEGCQTAEEAGGIAEGAAAAGVDAWTDGVETDTSAFAHEKAASQAARKWEIKVLERES